MENITLGQIAGAIAIITALWVFADRITKGINGALDKKLDPMKEDLEMLSSVTYEMLDHLATNNNSGGMKAALDKYVQYKIKTKGD